VPLPVVTVRVDRFIAEDGKGPYPDMEWVGLRVFRGANRWKSTSSTGSVRADKLNRTPA
jgi:hypothetical protein